MKIKISKEKIVMSITIGIACFALMLVMFMQFKVVKQTDIAEIENMRESELRVELSDWKNKYTELNERYTEVTDKIAEYKNEKESDQKTAQLLENELEQLNEILGKTDVTGDGIIIVLTDKAGEKLSDDVPVSRINEEDLLIIINELFGAGAEAISINDQRIVSMSDIASIGESFIKVNSERILSPYVIKAIGNQTYLESAVSGKGGYIDELKDLGHEATVEKAKKIKKEKNDSTSTENRLSTKYID